MEDALIDYAGYDATRTLSVHPVVWDHKKGQYIMALYIPYGLFFYY